MSEQENTASDSNGNTEDSCITLDKYIEIMEEEQKLIDDADAVLGGSDDKNCTYLMGYVNRQALYSCLTCKNESNCGLQAGVCLACSLNCHEGHNLVELYTKRNFRCDCGNSRFPQDFVCKLYPEKATVNEDNKYNQNFDGLYCTCHRPYPDPDNLDNDDDDMVQCIICEDWFHKNHLTTSLNKDSEDYDEVVCQICSERCAFIRHYLKFHDENPVKDSSESNINVTDESNNYLESKIVSEEHPVQNVHNESCDKFDEVTKSEETYDKCGMQNANNTSHPIAQNIVCRLTKLADNISPLKSPPIFLPSRWRKQLCTCQDCKNLYKTLEVEFLLHDGDTITDYEERGKNNSLKLNIDEQMSKMPHVQKVELINGYMDLKNGLCEYFKKFAENGKIVREEDISEFFTDLQKKKRQKTNNNQYFCK